MSPAPRLLVFELYHQGHHGQYVQVVLDYWIRQEMPGRLDLVVSPEFAERFPGLLQEARAHPRVEVHPTDEPAALRAKTGRRAVLANDLRIGRLLQQAVERHRPDHVLLMYADHVQLSLARGLRFGFPVRISGIYFRPSFYYRASGRGSGTAKARLDDVQKQTLLRLAMRNPHVDTLFSLDPYAVGPVRALAPARVKVVALPEAVEPWQDPAETAHETRRRLGIDEGRAVLLLFGSLDPRKGVRELLAALDALPEALAQRACLVMAGETTGPRDEIAAGIERLHKGGALQVVHLDAFVSDAEMHRLFAAADLVVLPYQQHVGSSGVLVRAAAAGVPVLGPAYGMLGARIDEHRLGRSVNTSDSEALVQGLMQFLDPETPFPFDPDAARALARANTNDAMAGTLFDHMLGRATPGR